MTKEMKPIIPPVEVAKMEAELTKDKFLRYTNFGHKKIFVVTHHDSPNVMLEIGRLREISFRDAGGGTGEEVDIDEMDTALNPYKQLLVWDDEEKEIIGGYRFIDCNLHSPIDDKGIVHLSTSELYQFSNKFKQEYIPYMIELGRSFVQPKFQASKSSRKNLFALDNLWDGIGAIVINNPNIQYLFGKVTMYTTYNIKARDMVLSFLKKFFPDHDNLVTPFHSIEFETRFEELEKLYVGKSYDENFKIMNSKVREYGEIIPPMINSYMSLSSTMKSFGTAINDHFGGVEETGILVKIADIYDSKKTRHIGTFERDKSI